MFWGILNLVLGILNIIILAYGHPTFPWLTAFAGGGGLFVAGLIISDELHGRA